MSAAAAPAVPHDPRFGGPSYSTPTPEPTAPGARTGYFQNADAAASGLVGLAAPPRDPDAFDLIECPGCGLAERQDVPQDRDRGIRVARTCEPCKAAQLARTTSAGFGRRPRPGDRFPLGPGLRLSSNVAEMFRRGVFDQPALQRAVDQQHAARDDFDPTRRGIVTRIFVEASAGEPTLDTLGRPGPRRPIELRAATVIGHDGAPVSICYLPGDVG